MFTWYTLSIITLFCQGFKGFLYKVSAEKKCNTAWTNFSFVLTVAILSTISFFIYEKEILDWKLLIILAFFGGITYSISTMSRIEALKHAATSVVFPITRLNGIVVVVFSLLYFHDQISLRQYIGIVLAVLVAFILSKQHFSEESKEKNFIKGIALSFLAVIFGSISSIIPKFAAINLNIFSFMMIAYIFNTLFTISTTKKLQGESDNPNHFNALVIGFLIGVANFFGFFAFLTALKTGPLSLVQIVQSLSFVIAIIFSILIYKEKITLRRFVGILLAIAAVILMKN